MEKELETENQTNETVNMDEAHRTALNIYPEFTNAAVVAEFGKFYIGETPPRGVEFLIRRHTTELEQGDTALAQRTLMAQAIALNSVFCSLARRVGLHLHDEDIAFGYLDRALQAQEQCRSTLQTLLGSVAIAAEKQ